jgi:hypothetical protein
MEDSPRPTRAKPKDRTLYTSLVHAQKSNILTVTVEPRRLNYPGSPVWQADENVAPLILLFAIAIVVMFVNMLMGIAAIVLAVPLYLLLVRPWILLRVSKRALESALLNAHNWEVIWRKGALTVTNVARRTQCKSPGGDWRSFVRDNVPIVEVEASVAHFGATARSEMPQTTVMSEDW